jgi:hypothetical protein
VECVPVETRIIQHPKVWEASGHVGGFNDPMVDCRETKQRYRYDHVSVFVPASGDAGDKPVFAYIKDSPSEAKQLKKAEKTFGSVKTVMLTTIPVAGFAKVLGPDAEKVGTLTEPKQFNLMFHSYTGATATADDKVYLRPETAQGVFVQFKNVVDTTRVKVPFGIGNTGTSFRNEVTPRNFTFRSREFEQAELEFFCHPDESSRVVQVLARLPHGMVEVHRPRRREPHPARAREGRTLPLLAGHQRRRVPLPLHRARLRRARGHRPPRQLRPHAARRSTAAPSSSTSIRSAANCCPTAHAAASATSPTASSPRPASTAACSRSSARRTRG